MTQRYAVIKCGPLVGQWDYTMMYKLLFHE